MKRGVIWLAVIAGLLVVAAGLAFYGLGFWLSPQSKLQKADAIVAISGGDTAARTAEAVQLYRQKWAPRIIFSGAALDPHSVSNARVMAGLAEAQGVPTAAILLEEQSTSTETNATDVARLVRQNGYHSIILVTSPYHQRRASILFHRAMPGVIIINHSSIDLNWRRSRWWATTYSRQLTFSEAQKAIYELLFR